MAAMRTNIREIKSRGFSREINLIDTVPKQATARLHVFKVELNPPLGGPHERRRAGFLVLMAKTFGPIGVRLTYNISTG